MVTCSRHFGGIRNPNRKIVALLIFLVLLVGIVAGSSYYSLVMQSGTTVSSPPVELQDGTAENSTSTIYANGTSAKVSVEVSGAGVTDVEDYVDDTSDVDNSTDKGTHSNFTAQKYGPDLINDTLTEGNITVGYEYIWISGNDDNVTKISKSDPGGPEILTWDTGTSNPFGCEHRIENGSEYIYVVDDGDTALIKFHANNGSEVDRWDISGYSGNPYGLAWNGSRWFISDWVDSRIYQVDPANPTVQERNFTYTGIFRCEGLAWDGSYLWAVDSDTDKVYQIDIYGNIQTSWNFTPTNPTGIAYDTTSGHLWIVGFSPYYLYEYYTNGTEINNWDPSGSMPQGCAYAYVEEQSYQLDLEVQWTNVDYDEPYELLCIYGGTMGAENITVDVWNGTGWENLRSDLNSGWNNVSVTSYLDSTNFTIRFKGGNETSDTTQTTWEIDAVLLHVWTEASGTDYVDNNTSDVDNSTDKGTHGNFTAQKYGPDLINDTLTEENTGSGSIWLSVNADDETKTDWTRNGTNPYLDAIDYSTNYVWISENNKLVGDFNFTDSGKSTETIDGVTVQLYAKQSGTNNNLEVFVWDGSAWTSLGTQATPTSWGWMNWTATTVLDTWTKIDGAKIYIKSRAAVGVFEVDSARLQVDYTAPDNYELDLEVQWTNVDYDEPYELLCIYGGTMGAENITVDVWNGSDWVENIFANLNSGWNNVSVTSYLDSSNFTIRFKGGNETGDTTQHTWDIDTTLLHVWTGTGAGSGDFNYVLNMTEKDGSNWKVRLKAYDNSSLSRIDNCTIYIYNGSNSTQIIILNGAYNQQIGPWIDLNASDTEYIWMHVETSSAGTSTVYVYLEIRVPNKTVYARYVILFEIT